MQIFAAGLQGLLKAEAAFERTASRIAKAGLETEAAPPEDRVELSQEFVNLIQARNAFAANVKSIQTGDELYSYLFESNSKQSKPRT